jgi:CDP-diglyceride synthetase
MTDDTDNDEFSTGFSGFGESAESGEDVDEADLPTYHSGRVRIIGAEPAGDSIREATGPVDEEHAQLPHWNDAPTGQVPAVLDRSNGEEPLVAPPTWREEETDWEAQEEVFEPSMLSEDLPAVGALLGEQEETDVEHQPWHFESDDTLVIPPEPGLEHQPAHAASEPPDLSLHEPFEKYESIETFETYEAYEPTTSYVPDEPVEPDYASEPLEESPRLIASLTSPARGASTAGEGAAVAGAAAAGSRLNPPEPPEQKARVPRTTRAGAKARTGNVSTAGTSGRDMRVAIGSGLLLGIAALACFAAGTVATMVIVCIVVLLASAEAYAAFRRAQYHPATLLGLVAVLSLLIETYNKGVAALPLVLVLLVAGSFIWYLARVEPAAEPVSGITSTVFVFVWVGAFGSFAALLLNPNLFPDRHGIAFILAAVIVTVADDVASLLVGSAMGRHQLAPSISPNKSWEGLLGGAVVAILVSVIVVHFIHPWTIGKAALYGVVVAIVAPLGDLAQSMIKRHLGIKDMGRILPGHGGVLDRVDGLLFVIPATYFVVKAMHLG